MADPTEINSVYWNEEKKSWEHKMVQVEEYHGFDGNKDGIGCE